MPDESSTTGTGNGRSRRGRPRAGEREQRRQKVIDAAFDELLESGYEKLTMLGIASRAGASKETLYSWFGNRDGLLAAMITDNADTSAERVRDALDTDADPHDTLTGYAIGLLTLLTDPRSIALNRAAMGSPELARTLLSSGRHRVGPIVEQYLSQLSDQAVIDIDNPAAAFTLLYGLVVQDTQIRVLLGEPPPSPTEIRQRASTAIDRFMQLT
jgi:AcrR family transcriptional regulator